MLLFDVPPQAPDGVSLLPEYATFHDHAKPDIVYYLPNELTLLSAAGGDPDFYLLRYHGDASLIEGGLLRFRLGFKPLPDAVKQPVAAAGWDLREAGFESARFRLRFRSLREGQSDELGEWHRLSVASRELVAPAISLNSHETNFLETLLADGLNPVEIDFDLRYSGLVRGMPWLVSAQTVKLRSLLLPSLPAGPVRADQVAAAFLSLPQAEADPLQYHALERGVPMPSRDAILAETAVRSLETLFERSPGSDEFAPVTYLLRSEDTCPPAMSWDLLPARKEMHNHAVSWAVGPFVQNIDTEEKRNRIFPSITNVSPFSQVEIHVINRVPYDPHFLTKAAIDLRYTGAAGVPEVRSFSFNGAADVQTFRTFFQTASTFQLNYRLTTTLAPPGGIGWPVVRKGEFIPAKGLVVEINREATGLDFVEVECEPDVFTKAGSILVMLYSSDPGAATPAPQPLVQLTLNSTRPIASVALPGISPVADIFTRVEARSGVNPEAPPVLLRCGRVESRSVHIAEFQVEVLDADRISVQLDPLVADRLVLVRVTLAPLVGDGASFTLSAGQPVLWNFFRDGIFDPIAYRYQVDYVAIDGQGRTLPMVSTGWSEAHGTSLVISPLTKSEEVHV